MSQRHWSMALCLLKALHAVCTRLQLYTGSVDGTVRSWSTVTGQVQVACVYNSAGSVQKKLT